eukprot:gb/GECG01008794.1/.p1 GENE.gb/GECG01008794.1/~~gb/GECG01008794.1/.p1  ORF type:complete len:114 (+),score=32.19 gb/GECG01008794.1/:1-342(+)
MASSSTKEANGAPLELMKKFQEALFKIQELQGVANDNEEKDDNDSEEKRASIAKWIKIGLRHARLIQQHEPNNKTIGKYIQNMLEWKATVESESEEDSEESDTDSSSAGDETS